MLKVATGFSGIGAFEQALKRLNIDHEILFACDNGERYLDLDKDEIIENYDLKKYDTFEDYIRDLYDKTGKENNVKKSYFANYDIDENKWYEDIRFMDVKQYKDQIDIFVGGSPCQSFSTYGFRRGLEDTRGTLFYDYARIIQDTHPKVFIFENVTGLLNHDNGKTWEIIKSTFLELDYDIKMEILNAKDYNLPQLRRRVFVVGIKKEFDIKDFTFPKKVELTRNSSMFLDKHVDNKYYLGEKGFKFVTDPSRNGRRARVNQEVIGCQTANQQFNWVGDFRVEKPTKGQLEDDKIYKGMYEGEISVARKMTPNELLRLMGFEKFNIVVPDKVIWRQTGNSIAVDVLMALVKEILDQVDLI
ncbi:DNA (cytosine-5)-methyltransferase 1 [Breznakia sp. PF5-3]|uniref:DNA cytosine methyltransferase n=1 Tax=unclassified Breznakia TaxID=2623764 RepID=UPI0024059E57|nr:MULTISPECIES: DNA (cytosine-5-)-methyltransferase [unclassified Breznakia]MDF9824456.1 DNA (cytosine-5)-methyltransferase 1 [Breznakia sp. PM6-1]MDF9835261.1 DNA (cytosine-5)-methyltransferase 1 [Breznakia sp. PF5-3]MDF9837411.1 DNA (cytosine-5)-methyltransferase 1 [Breznakia sp. PFB2-8]MDF9859346.1 DNA (cytosine-5)-methyltransferase 1 [Breznakia sp. PH5-24]